MSFFAGGPSRSFAVFTFLVLSLSKIIENLLPGEGDAGVFSSSTLIRILCIHNWLVWHLWIHLKDRCYATISKKLQNHLKKSCGYKPIGCGNFSGNQHVVVRQIR